jgi:hypothetical protein
MSLQYFTDDFLKKWLYPQDLIEYSSNDDRKIKAGMNWMSTIAKSSFSRYDEMWQELKEQCMGCMNNKCKEDYKWIIDNSEIVSTSEEYKTVKFKDKEIGRMGHEKLKNYNDCKKNCYEKVNLMNARLSSKFKEFNKEFSLCFIMCRGKPFHKENLLSDCYSDCFIRFSKKIPEIEFYIKSIFEQIIQEYKEKKYDIPGVDLIHNYRFKRREFNEDIMKKYL